MPDEPAPAPASELSGSRLVELARRDRAAARRALAGRSDDELARACSALRPGDRSAFLLICDHPERVAPLLPEADLVQAIRGAGMSEAAWLLEIATTEQRVACIDLDCRKAFELVVERVREWIDALIEAGRPTLVRALEEVDLEVWLLALRGETEVFVIGKEEEAPTGTFTADGVVYFAVPDEVSPHRLHEIVHALFHEDQALYWRVVYGLIFELPSECEEFALRWRTRRLQDLGFPDREQAMGVYRPLVAEKVETIDAESDTGALVEALELPRQLRGSLVGEALAQLSAQRAAEVLGYVLAVANSIAVADKLHLSDPESVPVALDKAVRGIDRGLRELARVRGRAPHEVLDTTTPLDLFRTGATLERELRGPYR